MTAAADEKLPKARDIAAGELQRIASRHAGRLLPADVVKAARAQRSPLHQFFTWDDTEAAHRFRINQARQLIRSFTVRFEVNEDVDMSARRWIPAKDALGGQESGYIAEEDVRDDPAMAAMTLRAMGRDWRAFKARYETQREFWDLVLAEAPRA